jgi:hypothetical protein
MAAWVLAAGQLVCGDRPKYKRIIYRAGLNLAACWVWAKLRGCETLGFQANMSNLWGKLNLAGARKSVREKWSRDSEGLKRCHPKKNKDVDLRIGRQPSLPCGKFHIILDSCWIIIKKKNSITWLDFDQDLIRDPIDPSQKKNIYIYI